MTKDNHLLGKFELSGIPPSPRGVPQIEVSFEIDVNGILHVSAEDKQSGHKETVTITNEKGRLTEEEILRMVKESEEFAEQDKKAREKVEAKNQLENYVYQIRNTIEDEEKGAKLGDEDKSAIKKAIEDAQEWIAENAATAEKDEFDEKYKELEKVVHPIFTRLYQQAGGPPGGEGGAPTDEEMPDRDEL